MSEKHREDRGDGQDDLIEQIITQGLEMINAPAEETPAETAPSAPGQEDSGGEDAPPANRKNRSPAVYLYLLILFGAAFMMLLLAYFAQRRSSEDAISDLRDSMDLSRQELLEQISAEETRITWLKEQNEALRAQLDRLDGDLAHWQEQYKEQTYNKSVISEAYADVVAKLVGWENSWLLEQSYQAGEYEDCVAILLLENMTEYGSFTPNKEIADRREEITQVLIDRGLLPEDRQIRISDYQDLIDAYNAKHPDHGPTGWANVSRETEG